MLPCHLTGFWRLLSVNVESISCPPYYDGLLDASYVGILRLVCSLRLTEEFESFDGC